MRWIIKEPISKLTLLFFFFSLWVTSKANNSDKADNCLNAHKSWARLNPDETICIDQTKDCVCLILSEIQETFRSVHNTLKVRNQQATPKHHSSVPEVCGRQRSGGKSKVKSVLN